MPDIVACFKWVVDEAYIKTGSSQELDMTMVQYKISDYDRNALEEAVRLYEEYGGSAVAITVGHPETTKGIKDALSRGVEKVYFVNDDSFVGLEPSQTAAILSDAIKKHVKFDLIICGEGSSDVYAQQVGPRLAEKLGIPCVCYAQKVEIKDNAVIVERKIEDGIEVLSVPMPALVTVVPDINSPRIPGVKDTLAASKKPVVNVGRSELDGEYEPRLISKGIRAASMARTCVKFGKERDDIAKFVEALIKEGVVR